MLIEKSVVNAFNRKLFCISSVYANEMNQCDNPTPIYAIIVFCRAETILRVGVRGTNLRDAVRGVVKARPITIQTARQLLLPKTCGQLAPYVMHTNLHLPCSDRYNSTLATTYTDSTLTRVSFEFARFEPSFPSRLSL